MKRKMPPDSPSEASSSSIQASDSRGSDQVVAYRSFLAPIDFSEHSNKTIEYATKLADLTGASIKILHVFQIPDYPAAFYQGLYLEHEAIKTHVETAKREATSKLSLVAEEIRAKGLEAEPILRSGNPYEEIVSAAEETGADLIVIGSHGYGGLGRLLLGSTAERVVQYAPCPVLVIKDPPGNRQPG
jgi:nucleotide-binding universal stress UspA family protein